MLTVDRLSVFYGQAKVLHEVSLRLAEGQVVSLLGRNGAGKTTTLRAIMGLVRARSGSVMLDAHELTQLRPHKVSRLGIAVVPQGRGLFPFLTVEENLRMGLLVRRNGDHAGTLNGVFELFPVLRERLGQRAGTLSGGEQQMVATARALCAAPRFLLMDEPTEGLMPSLVERLLETIRALRARGVGVLLVEQRIDAALSVADEAVLIETGHVRYQGAAADLAASPDVLLRYLGVIRHE